jgi:UDP-N-acetylmuramoylalanine--D-glutamate ligase
MYQNRKVFIIGLGISGQTAAQFLLEQGAKVSASDKNRALFTSEPVGRLIQQGMILFSENEDFEINTYDFFVVSPGVPTSNPIYKKALELKKEVIGEVELACRSIKQFFLAITGSNGKTTTTLLVEHVLRKSNLNAKALGNIGVPLTQALLRSVPGDSLVSDSTDIIIAELSSWQLETLESKIIDAAAILNITPNHLDRHHTMEAYAKAKIKIKNCLKNGKKLVMGVESYREFRPLVQNYPTITFGYTSDCDIFCDTKQVFIKDNVEFILPIAYRGIKSHDVENMMAAFALCKEVGISSDKFIEAFGSFKKPPHRIEFVRLLKGVSYYNDSKATNLDAVMKGVQSLKGTTILIAGGVHKGASYHPWICSFNDKVKVICAIGEASQQIKDEVGKNILVEIFSDLKEAVLYASKYATPGENVLLSPGCASYDMFKDYQHRGEEFKHLINSL